MNTFHQTIAIRNETHKTTEQMVLSEFQELTQEHKKNHISRSLRGIAVKLTILESLGISVEELLELTKYDILIDAEYERLDHWLIQNLNEGRINFQDLDRIIITIQIRRHDSIDQVSNLNSLLSYGLKCVLVAGHESYLQNTLIQTESTDLLFTKFIQSHREFKIGCGSKMVDKLSELGIKLKNNQILELQGYQKLLNSDLWVYFSGFELSQVALNYLQRRKSLEISRFIASSTDDLYQLSQKHRMFVFLDCNSRQEYIQMIKWFEEIANYSK